MRAGSSPARWRSLFARAQNNGRIPLSTVFHGLNSPRPGSLRSLGCGTYFLNNHKITVNRILNRMLVASGK